MPHSDETKKKISDFQREKNKERIPNLISKGYKETIKKARQSFQWKDWRMAVFKRDNYTCQECKTKGGKLEPHHITPIRSDIGKLFDTKNGITLCRKCHMKTFGKESDFMEKYYKIVAVQMLAYL